jgi:hypothetical protein
MLTKISTALAIIVAICSGAVAGEKRQGTAENAFTSTRPIVHCVHGVWDSYGLRCDKAPDLLR